MLCGLFRVGCLCSCLFSVCWVSLSVVISCVCLVGLMLCCCIDFVGVLRRVVSLLLFCSSVWFKVMVLVFGMLLFSSMVISLVLVSVV